MPALDSVVERIESASALDGPSTTLQRVLRRVFREGPVTDVLRGGPLGHPAHPALVLLPIGAWTSATIADLFGERSAAHRLTGVGCIAAIPAAAAGATDYLQVDGARRRVATTHALVNDAALLCYTMSWTARRHGRYRHGFLLSLIGGSLVTAGGWLGGHLAYRQGVGVDTTRFEQREARRAAGAHQDRLPG